MTDRFAALGLFECYQCGKCTAGCPTAARMTIAPNQILRLLQSGHEQQALAAESPWICVACQTCSTRCPQHVDCAAILDVLRQAAYESGVVASNSRRTALFYRAFLNVVRRNGRLDELALVAGFKTSAVLNDLDIPFLFKDALLAPKAVARGKLHFSTDTVADRGVVNRIFERCLTEV
jgi:heterodisulfide reductase subunit C